MKILIAGAGGAPSEGVIHSLLKGGSEEIIGMGSEVSDLVLSAATKKYHVPYANAPEYKQALLAILRREKPDLVHFQNDLEIFHASLLRSEIEATGTRLFMPAHEVIDTCVHKHKTYLKFKAHGLKVPTNVLIENETQLRQAFHDLGDDSGTIWLRSTAIGGGGKGALPTNDFAFAKGWIQRFSGWGSFAAASMLTSDSVTWLSIWHEGDLVVAQTRARKGWMHGNRTLSGVTGVTKVGQTHSDDRVNEIATNAVKAVTSKPHGIFGVDLTYDKQGVPNPTEINVSRFFTTILFFTEAGLNMPRIFKDLALYGKFPKLQRRLNPLPDGLMWFRGVDTKPKLVRPGELEQLITVPEPP